MSEKVRKQLAGCYTGVVHDVMRAKGFRNFTLPHEIRPIVDGEVLCGPVFTIEGRIDETVDGHESLLAWTGLLSKAKSGHIWVSQPNDRTVGHMGELSAEALQKNGVLGCVLDGGVRDSEFLRKIGFAAWHRFFTPRDIVGRWLPTGFDVPIIIGEVQIKPGDFLLGDRDGMLRVPKEHAEEITTLAVEAMHTENKVRTAILAGEDPQAAYLKYGKF